MSITEHRTIKKLRALSSFEGETAELLLHAANIIEAQEIIIAARIAGCTGEHSAEGFYHLKIRSQGLSEAQVNKMGKAVIDARQKVYELIDFIKGVQ